MTYSVRLRGFDDSSSDEDRRLAEQRFRKTLEAELGDAELVLPLRDAYLRITATYGEDPPPDVMTDAEHQVFSQWQSAESAAITAALGPHRYLEDAWFEIGE
jgi:hypothetical protein